MWRLKQLSLKRVGEPSEYSIISQMRSGSKKHYASSNSQEKPPQVRWLIRVLRKISLGKLQFPRQVWERFGLTLLGDFLPTNDLIFPVRQRDDKYANWREVLKEATATSFPITNNIRVAGTSQRENIHRAHPWTLLSQPSESCLPSPLPCCLPARAQSQSTKQAVQPSPYGGQKLLYIEIECSHLFITFWFRVGRKGATSTE